MRRPAHRRARGQPAVSSWPSFSQPPSRASSLQAVALPHLRVSRVDRAQAGGRQAIVDLLEVAADEIPLGIRDLAAMGLAGVFEAGVVDPGPHASSGGGL